MAPRFFLMDENGFFDQVYDIVAQIPSGYVTTYSQIARALGYPKRAQVVGWAMRKAPVGRNLPCHRVVRSSGVLAPWYVFGDQCLQRNQLEDEKVTFTKEGVIDMKKHLWLPRQGVTQISCFPDEKEPSPAIAAFLSQ